MYVNLEMNLCTNICKVSIQTETKILTRHIYIILRFKNQLATRNNLNFFELVSNSK